MSQPMPAHIDAHKTDALYQACAITQATAKHLLHIETIGVEKQTSGTTDIDTSSRNSTTY